MYAKRVVNVVIALIYLGFNIAVPIPSPASRYAAFHWYR